MLETNMNAFLHVLGVLDVSVSFFCTTIVTILTMTFCVKSIKFFDGIKQLMENKLWIFSFLTMVLTCIELSSMILTYWIHHWIYFICNNVCIVLFHTCISRVHNIQTNSKILFINNHYNWDWYQYFTNNMCNFFSVLEIWCLF